MSGNNIDIFAGLYEDDYDYKDEILKAPFAYVGGKTKSLSKIMPVIPYRKTYIEPFGGSGVIMLNRRPSNLDVFNDRYSGVIDFYRCLQNEKLMDEMIGHLQLCLHSRELFHHNKREWVTDIDPARRAAKWYTMARHSFSGKMNNWGRNLNSATRNMADKIYRSIPDFQRIHDRIKNVQFENRDALTMLKEYDSSDAVFYLDPPYVDSYNSTYKYELSHDDHRRLIDLIFRLDGYVAVSGYDNILYDDQGWDDKITWEVQSMAAGNNNERGGNKTFSENNNLVKECLWIKY